MPQEGFQTTAGCSSEPEYGHREQRRLTETEVLARDQLT
jgi:hypothetical protein